MRIFGKTIRNNVESYATAPQVFANWDFSAPYSLNTDAGEALFWDIACEIGREFGYSDAQIEAIAEKVASRIGDGLFTEQTARLALRREFHP